VPSGWSRSPPLPPASRTGCAGPCSGWPPSPAPAAAAGRPGTPPGRRGFLLQPLAPGREEGVRLPNALQVGGQRGSERFSVSRCRRNDWISELGGMGWAIPRK
jgi:hypothetical protein